MAAEEEAGHDHSEHSGEHHDEHNETAGQAASGKDCHFHAGVE